MNGSQPRRQRLIQSCERGSVICELNSQKTGDFFFFKLSTPYCFHINKG